MATRPVRSVFNIFSPSVKFSFLCSPLAGDKHSYLPLMDSLTGYYFLECYFHWIYALGRVIFTPNNPSCITLELLLFLSTQPLLHFLLAKVRITSEKNTHLLFELSYFQLISSKNMHYFWKLSSAFSISSNFPLVCKVRDIGIEMPPVWCVSPHNGSQSGWQSVWHSYQASSSAYIITSSTEMASLFNYPSCQLRWKNTASDKACPHSLISHRPFSHHQM